MSRKIKVCLALFLSFAVLAQYSFTPQAMVAYGMDNTVEAAQAEEPSSDSGESSKKQETTKPAQESTKATEAPAPAPATTSESTEATEATESTEAEDQTDDVEDENDVNTGDPIAGEDQAAEEEEEVKYPAASFTKSAGGVSVHISAPEGALPEGATVKVSAVSAEQYMGAIESAVGSEVEKAKAVDITFYNKDGKEIEPKKAVSVRMSASGISADSVVHISGGGANEIGASTSGGSASFRTANFSIYALVQEKPVESEDGIITIKYEAKEGGSVSPGSEPIDLNEDSVEASGSTATAENGFTFVNWTDEEGKVVSTDASFKPVVDKDVSKPENSEEETLSEVTFYANFEEAEPIEVTFNPTTDPEEPLAPIKVSVNKGETIGDKLPAVPEIPGYTPKWVVEDSETEVTADTVVDEPFTAVVDKGEKITYTVTFVQADGTKEFKTTDIDAGFAINDLPEVAPKTNKVGKWVYPGTTNEFTVGTVISQDLTVEAYYDQNIFTVTFMVDGAKYEEMTTATGTTIVLPSDPIKEGATFKGWFTEEGGQGDQYTAESTVDKDLTLYAFFEDQVRVKFLVKDEKGDVISEKSQYFIDLKPGDAIQTLPEDPFMEGKTFVRWVDPSGNTVEEGYTVTESFDAVAEFNGIEEYELTVNYFYKNEAGTRVDIGSQVYDLVGSDFPYTVTAPGYTIATEVTDEPTYYPSQPTITVEADQFTKDGDKYVYSVDDEYVAADADYKVGHYLKALSGSGYELIETEDKVGVKNSKVTPEIKNYPYADYESRDENVTITGDPDQELKVYYTRRDFTLSYNVAGGEYIDAVTAPYGTKITLPASATRTGYTFDGWYKDAEYAQSASSPFTLEENTTLYAKWTPAQVDYKIVYMIENANDDGYSFLKDVTKQAETDTSLTLNKAQADSYAPSDLDKQNFTFESSTTETIKADGSSVIVVKYKRNVYTINWNGDVYNTDGQLRARNQGSGSVTAKFGATITPQWVAAFNNKYPNYAWSPTTNNNDKVISIDTMPGRGDAKWTFNNNNVAQVKAFDFSTTKTQTLNYWLENYEGSQTTTRDGKTYGLYKSVTGRFNYLYDNADFYPIDGYSKDGYTATYHDRWGYTHNYTLGNRTPDADLNVNFYYAAQRHHLTFYNYDGTLISDQEVKLNANISNYLTSNVPAAPVEGATWLGWFTDAEHTQAYDGGTKMPAGLVLYGDFQFPNRTVTYDSQGGSAVAPETKEYGFYATTPDDPTRDNYTFQGWFTEKGETGSPYDWNQPVTQNITLYAHWTQKTISYKVHYYEKGTTTSIIPDKVVSDPKFAAGDEITETAPTVAGHVADAAEKSIELSFDEDSNTITFYYSVIPDELTYTVNYVLKDKPTIKVAKSKTVTVPGTTTNALEMAVEVDKDYFATQTSDADILGQNYKPTETSKELQLALENNVITFEYVPYTSAKITVNYLDMDGNEIEDTDTTFVEKGDTYTVQNKSPDGYVYHHAYLHGTTTAPQPTYQIKGDEGNIEIDIYYQKKLIILANNKSKAYDGTPLKSSFETAADYTVTGTLRGDTVTSIEFDGSQTEAGTSATTPKNAKISKGADAITDPETYYSIIYVPGSLTVKPVSVYISVSADQWNTHSGGEGPNYYTGDTFNAGFTNPNKQRFNDGSGSAYVSITSGARALFMEKYRDAIWNALAGENDGALISEKDAGKYTVTGDEQKAKLASVEVDGKKMMSDTNYSITLYARDSFLQIDPLPLNIKTGSAEKPYDGDPLTKDDVEIDYNYWTANIGGEWTADQQTGIKSGDAVTLGTGDVITFDVTGERTEVGESDNTYTIEWGDAKASNYAITNTLGTLKVTNVPLSVEVKDKTTTYNGKEQYGRALPETITGTGETIETDDYIVKGLMKGHVLTVEYTAAKGTNAGDYEGAFDSSTLKITDAEGTDVTSDYTVKTFTPGTLTIKPNTDEYEITVTGKSAKQPYNGSEQKVSGYTVSEYDQSIEFTGLDQDDAKATAKGTDANTYTMTMSESDFSATSDNYTNIKITVVPGTLKITPRGVTVTISGSTASHKYNGEEQTVKGYSVKINDNLYKESDINYSGGTAEVKETNAGTYDMGLNSSQFTNTNSNFNVSFNVADGKLTISKRNVTVTSASATKVYDGTALTNNKITISGDGFVNGETPAFRVTGSRTAVGKSKNTFDILPNTVQSSAALDLVRAAANGFDANNYNIDKVYGTLTVTAAATPTPTPTPGDGTVTPTPPGATVIDNPIPTTINDEPAPRAAAGFWALINLICAILTALLSLIMLIRYFGKRREEDEETGEVTEINRKGGVRLASIIPAIGAIIAFILTEDMSLPMQMVDKWTVLMVVILAIQVLVAIFAKKKEDEDDEEDEGAMA